MNPFLQDIIHDLREKRLWPVAAVLALAVLAVPAVLLKGSEPQSAPADQAAAPAGGAAAAAIAEPVGDGKGGSDLGSFDPKNPFKPGVKPPKDLATALVGLQGSGADAGVKPPSTGGGGGGGVTPGGSGGGGAAPIAPQTRTAKFTYVIDVTFVKNGRSSKRRGLRRLSMLPNQDAPLLLFLGVDDAADNAIFLVDSTLKAFGEGRCAPSAGECGTLSLGSGAEHEFTDGDDNSYGIRIDEIRRVRASSAKSSKASAAKASRRAARASTSRRRFVPPFLTDIETQTTTGAKPTSSATEGR